MHTNELLNDILGDVVRYTLRESLSLSLIREIKVEKRESVLYLSARRYFVDSNVRLMITHFGYCNNMRFR